MLEKTHTPAALLLGALAGVLAATLCILGSAAWMAMQGCSASMAWPLATVSVCVGGFCGSALAAFWKKEQGLLTGLLLGGLFAAALSGLLLMSGGLFDTPALLRMAAVLLCSCAGGCSGPGSRREKTSDLKEDAGCGSIRLMKSGHRLRLRRFCRSSRQSPVPRSNRFRSP